MTYSESEIAQLSVTAQQCIAAICLQRFCSHYQIVHDEIEKYIAHLWRITQITPDKWLAWENGFSQLVVSGMGEPLPQDVLNCVPISLHTIFTNLLGHVLETSAATWYGNDLPATKTEFVAVLKIMQQHGIDLPEIMPFAAHPKLENGWGANLTEAELHTWRMQVQPT